jgi:hypothetical protein
LTGLTVIDGLSNIDVDIPVDARGFRLMMGWVPFPMVVVVVVVVTTFVAAVAVRQGKYNSAKEKSETQHVFERMLHKICLKYSYLKSCQM